MVPTTTNGGVTSCKTHYLLLLVFAALVLFVLVLVVVQKNALHQVTRKGVWPLPLPTRRRGELSQRMGLKMIFQYEIAQDQTKTKKISNFIQLNAFSNLIRCSRRMNLAALHTISSHSKKKIAL